MIKEHRGVTYAVSVEGRCPCCTDPLESVGDFIGMWQHYGYRAHMVFALGRADTSTKEVLAVSCGFAAYPGGMVVEGPALDKVLKITK